MTLLKELLEANGIVVVPGKGKNAFLVKLKGKAIGSVWKNDDETWGAEYDATGASWECDSKKEAVEKVSEQLNEDVVTEAAFAGDISKLDKMFSNIQEKIELVEKLLKTDSVFDRKFKQCDGDTKHLAQIVKMQAKVYDEFQELYQYTMSKLESDNE